MLDSLSVLADELKMERTSIWTFAKKNTAAYSSITRENYLGFGPSAATLLSDIFKLNTFDVEAYIEAVNGGSLPTALTLSFSKRSREVYWLFWSSYRMKIDTAVFSDLFGKPIEKDFGGALKTGIILGLIKKQGTDYFLTGRGSYLFHLIEQHYTHQYIDKTWKTCRSEPWPTSLNLY